ncbi:negative regulator of systemic acquired resistance SNI1 isoform X1 [Spinacia oleracea]|uniref:Negative regulator of systemic acquired resistance SNI1 isoform X1 n=1 Tax=Spinacia oleracea TaxID=3562 RepID=A0A9R0KB29_SPIOL|nr:negative regulator of systemic acquired resistance SNI1 isoform X1 [Spinacia oleracea]
MEKSRRRAASNRGIEENTLAILESFCEHDSSHVHDDRLAFLDAVRFASIVPENGPPPTNKMMEAIFEIMREAKSLELIVVCYQLLCELEKHFPRVYLSNGEDKQVPSSKTAELVVFEKAWLPFAVGSDVASNDKHVAKKGSKEPVDAVGFHLLLQNLCELANETESSEPKLEVLAKMVLFQYLVYIFEADFLPRNHNFLENSDWISLRDSLVNKLMGSRRINYKDLTKDSLFVLCNLSVAHTPTECDVETTEISIPDVIDNDSDLAFALALSFPETVKCTLKAVQKLLEVMMELDLSRKKADTQGLTTRADGARTPVVELIMDELSYDKDLISPFLQAFDNPRLKLEIIVQYIQKYNVKPYTRKRKSADSQGEAAVTGFFKCFLNSTTIKGIVKKVGAEAVQVLLAQVLQACMSIPKEKLLEEISDLKDDGERSPLVHICKNIISAFTKLRETDEHLQILPIGKEALFTAASVLSSKS